MTQLQFFLRAGDRRPASQMMPAAWELAEAPETRPYAFCVMRK
ncbi:hypothetical protein [Oceanibaculum nanhaiense]|nr:hypothetical protein [Oceanibaculum nanhaiense]